MRKKFRFTASWALLAFAAWAGLFAPPVPAQAQAALPGQVLPGSALPGLLSAALPDQPRISAMSGGASGLPGADGKAGEAPPNDNALGGGLLGALFFGVPYQGLNSMDFAAMTLLGLLVYRRLNARPKKDERRFTLHSREEAGPRPAPPESRAPEREWGNAADAGDKASDAPGGTGAPGAVQGRDPRDNPWSRRLGAALQSPPDSPWLKGRDRAGTQDRSSAPGGAPRMPGTPLHGSAGPTPGARGSDGLPSDAPVFGGPVSDGPLSDGLANGVLIPADFDLADFLEGARALYVRLQKAWAGREMSDLQSFLTPEMLALLQKRANGQPLPLGLNIMRVEAVLTGLVRHEGLEEARVLFEALMAADEEAPAKVREEWLFRRGPASRGLWQLAGIRGA